MNGEKMLRARLETYKTTTGRCWFSDNWTSLVAREVKKFLEGGKAPSDKTSLYRLAMAVQDDLAKVGVYV